LSRSLTPISIIKSSAKFFVILAALVAIIGCGDGITGQVGGIGEDSFILGTEGTGDGEFDRPTDVAVASDGSVYVADLYNQRIQKFTSEGVFVSEWGTGGSGDGEFMDPEGVAVAPDGSVYVADAGNHRIQKFTSEGVFVSKWDTWGEDDWQGQSYPIA
jgi:DNA-binding beta-propeller fold protein YncE